MSFKEAVERTPHLENSYEEGLGALRAEDRKHIEAEDTRRLMGSAYVDEALKQVQAHQNANRWDFAIGYQHVDRKEEVIYWTEIHTASDGEVKVVIRKAQWLLAWLKGEGAFLSEFEREIFWVSSGATSFTLTAPQRKQMAAAGLRHVGLILRIRNQKG